MRIAFVGVKRKYQELAPEYRNVFNRFHLELPYYYARDGNNHVTITTVDYSQNDTLLREWSDPWLDCQLETDFQNVGSDCYKPDVVVHWRKWFPEFWVPGAINLINCQDHSFSQEWQASTSRAFIEGKLKGILCFPTWHKRNLLRECPWLPESRAFDGVTLGVDTDIYKPAPSKNPYQMLWASDIGRGLDDAMKLTVALWRKDKRFKLHVCSPDYARLAAVRSTMHPAWYMHGNMKNGPELWDLFNTSGILPYTSNFMEPSSRAHRQAQAAGCLVLYPPSMGSPSELIEDHRTGIVTPIERWVDTIVDLVGSGRWQEIGTNARSLALSQNWEVQAKNFNFLISSMTQGAPDA